MANSDTRYMGFVAGQYVRLVLPDCVVLDYQELGYAFGDSLFSVNDAIESEYEGRPVSAFAVSNVPWLHGNYLGFDGNTWEMVATRK